MVNKCHCYHTQKKTRYTYNQYTGSPIPHDIEVGVCWGTKETDECKCDGDETKCDFYPEVRAKAKKELKKNSTNAANIRSMSDKKLASYLVDIGWDCPLCSEHDRLDNEPLLHNEKCDEQCVQHCLEWLKKTAKSN